MYPQRQPAGPPPHAMMNTTNPNPTRPHHPSRQRWRCRRCRHQLGSLREGILTTPLGRFEGTGRCASRCPRCGTVNVIGLRAALAAE